MADHGPSIALAVVFVAAALVFLWATQSTMIGVLVAALLIYFLFRE